MLMWVETLLIKQTQLGFLKYMEIGVAQTGRAETNFRMTALNQKIIGHLPLVTQTRLARDTMSAMRLADLNSLVIKVPDKHVWLHAMKV
jgi:hypothetical protein